MSVANPKIAFAQALLLLLLLPRIQAHSSLPPVVLKVINDKERYVRRLAKEATKLFLGRQHNTPCDCSIHVCRTGFSQHACGLIKLKDLCMTDDCTRPEGAVTFVETPPGVDTHSVGNEMKENICLYKSMEPILLRLNPKPDTTTRISIKDGHSRVYPGSALRADLDKREELSGDACGAFDPRGTDYYIGASVGPKDVVFVVDASDEMHRPWSRSSNDSRWNAIVSAVQQLLDGFSAMDRVNIVAYSDKARRRGVGAPLYVATGHELDLMKRTLSSLKPSGDGDLLSGLRLGFRLLYRSSLDRLSIEQFHRGQKVVVVITGSSNHGNVDGRVPVASDYLKRIKKWQKKILGIAGSRASVFTYSIGEDVDDGLLQQIACANDGAWFSIGADNDAYALLNSYNGFLASTHGASYPVWTNFFRHPIDKSIVTTVAKAFHFKPENGVRPLLLGVVSHEVRLDDLEIEDVTRTAIEAELIRRSQRHDAVHATPCRLQVQRNVFANQSICIDAVSVGRRKKKKRITERPPCVESDGLLCKTFFEKRDWDEAALSCSLDGGSLAVYKSLDQLTFLASIASVDGSWIDEQVLEKIKDAQSITSSNSSGCLMLDTSGLLEKTKHIDCGKRLSYICTYRERKRCPKVIHRPKRGYFTQPPLNVCFKEEEALADAGALPTATSLSSSHLWCSLDHGERDLRSLCCMDCRYGKEGKGSVETGRSSRSSEDV